MNFEIFSVVLSTVKNFLLIFISLVQWHHRLQFDTNLDSPDNIRESDEYVILQLNDSEQKKIAKPVSN